MEKELGTCHAIIDIRFSFEPVIMENFLHRLFSICIENRFSREYFPYKWNFFFTEYRERERERDRGIPI